MLQCLLDQSGNIRRLSVCRDAAGEIQQVSDGLLGSAGLIFDDAQIFLDLFIGLRLGEFQEIGRIGNDAQGITEFVAHASSHLTEYSQPFLLHQLFLSCMQLSSAIDHTLFQIKVEPADFFFGLLRSVMSMEYPARRFLLPMEIGNLMVV